MSAVALAAAAVLVFTWVGYPLLARLVGGRRAPRPVSGPAADRPHVSVVVATRDEAAVLRRRVQNLLESDYPSDRLEVVIARDARALPLDAADAVEGVRVVAGDEPGGKASALNAGVRAARGSVLVFADSWQRFEPQTIGLLADALGNPAMGAVSGQLALGESSRGGGLIRLYWRMERSLRDWEARWDSAIGVTGAVWAMRRSEWQPLADGVILDDVHTPMRLVLAGWRVGFEGRAVAHETRMTAPEHEYRRKVRTLTGVYQVCALLPSVLVPWRNRVWMQFVSHKLLRLATPLLLLAVAIGIAMELPGVVRRHPQPAGLVTAALLVALAGLAIAGRAGALARACRVAAQMNAAIIVATWNALRGRWGVWLP